MRTLLLLLLSACLPTLAQAYPLDGYAYTGIKRLEYYRLVHEGVLQGPRFPHGQYLGMEDIQPRWSHSDGSTLPPVDAAFSSKLGQLLDSKLRAEYGVAVLDLSDPEAPRLGLHNALETANAGSVGKVLVGLAIFHQLAQLYPEDIAARERVLRDTRVVADAFSQYDHHVVPFFDVEKRIRTSRSIRVGDVGSLWEYLDWMLSPSSSSAAAMLQKELIALAHFGSRYPVSDDEKAEFFRTTSRTELGRIFQTAQTDAVVAAGLNPEQIRQSSFFTTTGNRLVVANGRSWATPEQLLRFLFKLEAGTLIDAWTSRELKRLMYMTQRRIRYASHPALNDAAVYFKSGSFFQCHTGPRGCKKYMGDKTNRLASVAIIESPADNPRLRYLVAVMSNVLHVNSAVAHQTLAMRIQQLIESYHPGAPVAKPQPELPADQPAVPVDGTD